MSHQEPGNSPRPIKPTSKCAKRLEEMGIEPFSVPTYNSVIKFVSDVKKKIPSMDQDDMACVQRQMTLMKRNAGASSSPPKITLKQEVPRVVELIEKQTKRLAANGKTGRMKMGAPRDFKFVG